MGFIKSVLGVGASLLGASSAKKAAKKAANAQIQASQQAIAEQTRQFDITRADAQPFITAGGNAITQQGNLIGLNGTASQQDALNAILASPQFTTLVGQGEDAILQNASATGGLRGGNLQNSLAKFRASTFASLIEDQFNKLGGVSSLGAGSTFNLGSLGAQNSQQIGNLITQQGQARAGAALASGNATAGIFNSIAGIAGGLSGSGNMGQIASIFGRGGNSGGGGIVINPAALPTPGQIGGFTGAGF